MCKGTGPDEVSQRLLKHCDSELSAPLTTVFLCSLSDNKCPSVWKEARVVPIHKKSSRHEPSSYKSVSLLSMIGKVLEQVVNTAFYQHLDENHLLSERQFGFRLDRSTADLLLLLLSKDCQGGLEGGLDALVVAQNISGAFDRVWHAGLVKKFTLRLSKVTCSSFSKTVSGKEPSK